MSSLSHTVIILAGSATIGIKSAAACDFSQIT